MKGGKKENKKRGKKTFFSRQPTDLTFFHRRYQSECIKIDRLTCVRGRVEHARRWRVGSPAGSAGDQLGVRDWDFNIILYTSRPELR